MNVGHTCKGHIQYFFVLYRSSSFPLLFHKEGEVALPPRVYLSVYMSPLIASESINQPSWKSVSTLYLWETLWRHVS